MKRFLQQLCKKLWVKEAWQMANGLKSAATKPAGATPLPNAFKEP